jgi:hypothetical protein
MTDFPKELAKLRAEIDRRNIRIREDAEAALQYLNEIDHLRAENATLLAHVMEVRSENERLQLALDHFTDTT